MKPPLTNREEAGKLLALRLNAYAQQPEVIVLGLPRGGVPVAFSIAQTLKLPLDICLVRKLGVPEREELAMGAIATGDVTIINHNIVNSLGVTNEILDQVIQSERQELQRREQVYRGDRPYLKLQNQTVILVDDGIATGSTMLAAIQAVNQQKPQLIVVATPIVFASACSQLQTQISQLICLIKPKMLYSISCWYEDFTQVSDAEVCYYLSQTYLEK
ncbi:phosphoribosyltransferase [Gloeocapsa sp. PCC 73106]|uniref:phosphoribosyltransferase n=1 Tax=Gloeocapsa sp. PCC 73106 TaxID=102232 RepID=UPI0002ABEBD8|nr:phosphoribosyltransferase [Gloeocapsa sp. PCC 73106]ELR99407.1 putative phosphoribosyltransferase [Gloeocapsa sp. PCC 73106]